MVIPDSVTRIGDEAFNNCTNLESVTIRGTNVEIGRSAFRRTQIINLELDIGIDRSQIHEDAFEPGVLENAIVLEGGSRKRKSTKRKSTKRKSAKRKSAKRKFTKRKSAKKN